MSHSGWQNGVATQESLLISNQPSSTNAAIGDALPAAPSETSSNTIEETVWANIETYLRTRRGPRPLVLCCICEEELVVPGLQEDNGQRETMKKLPCGHVLGAECVGIWINTRLNDSTSRDTIPKCPYCRAPIMTNVSPSQVMRSIPEVASISIPEIMAERNREEARGGVSTLETIAERNRERGRVERDVYYRGRRNAVADYEPNSGPRNGGSSLMDTMLTTSNNAASPSSSRRTQTRGGTRIVEARHPDSDSDSDSEDDYYPNPANSSTVRVPPPNTSRESGSRRSRTSHPSGARVVTARHPDKSYPDSASESESPDCPTSRWSGPWPPVEPTPTPRSPGSGPRILDARHPSELNPDPRRKSRGVIRLNVG
ncbi:hypothetical protein B0T14DRAFT_497420 [Immersiella caudata]|uniref:RING-type domain-containing protein n=1 Tax=Immersiella caudata TaxID=314043 RepID=A0AA39WSX7_9PEZI|nr:hypothetical protein B0T14DRAFT_497420 [Immersiella caudata]